MLTICIVLLSKRQIRPRQAVMLRKLARLLFGGQESEEAASAPEEVRSEELGEEWLVVNGQGWLELSLSIRLSV